MLDKTKKICYNIGKKRGRRARRKEDKEKNRGRRGRGQKNYTYGANTKKGVVRKNMKTH